MEDPITKAGRAALSASRHGKAPIRGYLGRLREISAVRRLIGGAVTSLNFNGVDAYRRFGFTSAS